MRRSFKFRLRPTAKQHVALGRCLETHRELYNAALQERREAYQRTVRSAATYHSVARPKCPVMYTTQAAQLSEIRSLRPDLAEWSFSSQQTTLRRLDKAFAAFFRRVKMGVTPGYPRFKSPHRFNSVEWPKDGDGCRWHPEAGRVYFQGIGQIKVSVHRAVKGRVKTLAVKREGRRWMLVLSCEDVPPECLAPTGKEAGFDLGIRRFLTLSDGEFFGNPRYGKAAATRLASAQQRLSIKKRGSHGRRRARETVARRHRKIANQRRDFHHQTARKLVERYDTLFVEDLNVANMTRRVKARPDPKTSGSFLPNGQAAKSGLNRSITDAGWGAFISILCAKAEEAGRMVVCVDPRHTSDCCEVCGHAARENRVSERFCCVICGHSADADEHAARNVYRAGLALRGPVGPTRPTLAA